MRCGLVWRLRPALVIAVLKVSITHSHSTRFTYSSASETASPPIDGRFATYDGSGFVAEFANVDRQTVTDGLASLKVC